MQRRRSVEDRNLLGIAGLANPKGCHKIFFLQIKVFQKISVVCIKQNKYNCWISIFYLMIFLKFYYGIVGTFYFKKYTILIKYLYKYSTLQII